MNKGDWTVQATEDFIVHLLEDCNLCAIHAKRVTISKDPCYCCRILSLGCRFAYNMHSYALELISVAQSHNNDINSVNQCRSGRNECYPLRCSAKGHAACKANPGPNCWRVILLILGQQHFFIHIYAYILYCTQRLSCKPWSVHILNHP